MIAYRLYIDPFSSLFFKGSSTFNAGEDVYAHSIFPPPPAVVFGFLQSLIYDTLSDTEKPSISSSNLPDPKLKITGISLEFGARGVGGEQKTADLFYQLPMDIVFPKGEFSPDKATVLEFLPNGYERVVGAGKPYFKPPSFYKLFDTRDKVYISLLELNRYIHGEVPRTFAHIREYTTPETKVGLAINSKTGIAEESMLYSIEMINMRGKYGGHTLKETRICIDVESTKKFIGEQGPTRMGGEARMVSVWFKEGHPEMNFKRLSISSNGEVLKIVCLSPMLIHDTLQSTLSNNGFKIITLLSDRYQTVGGWNMRERRPKPSLRYMPAGSVLFVEVEDKAQATQFISEYQGKAFPFPEMPNVMGENLICFCKMINT